MGFVAFFNRSGLNFMGLGYISGLWNMAGQQGPFYFILFAVKDADGKDGCPFWEIVHCWK